jgi:signal peptidase II
VPGAGGAQAGTIDLRRIGIVTLAVVACDLLTKALVLRELAAPGSVVRVVGDYVRLIYIRNTGSAFSLFQAGRLVFIGVSVASIALILVIARSSRAQTAAHRTALGLILGGAIGNLYDRIVYGSVIDWIDVGVGFHRWPTFNVADIGVSVGVGLLALLLLRQKDGAEAAPDGAGSG